MLTKQTDKNVCLYNVCKLHNTSLRWHVILNITLGNVMNPCKLSWTLCSRFKGEIFDLSNNVWWSHYVKRLTDWLVTLSKSAFVQSFTSHFLQGTWSWHNLIQIIKQDNRWLMPRSLYKHLLPVFLNGINPFSYKSANSYDVTINCQELTKFVDLLCWKIMHNNDLQALVPTYRPHPKLRLLFSVKIVRPICG